MRRVPSGGALGWGLAAFFGIQLGLSALIAVTAPEVRDPQYYEKADLLRQRLPLQGPRPLTVVAMGTSRTDQGFWARGAEEELTTGLGRPVVAQNLGIAGAEGLSRVLYLRRLLRDGGRPDLLVIEVLPAALNGAAPYSELTRLPGTRLEWDELAVVARHGGSAPVLGADWGISWLVPSYFQRFGIARSLGKFARRVTSRAAPLSNVDGWGFRQGALTITDEERKAGYRLSRGTYRFLHSTRFRLGERQCAAYRELLEACRREGIATAMVWMPEGPVFQSLYAPGVIETVEAFLTELGRECGAEVIIARDWITDENEFYDSHHLTKQGAVKYTRRLTDELLRRGLVRESGRWSERLGKDQIEGIAKTADHGVAERDRDRAIDHAMIERE